MVQLILSRGVEAIKRLHRLNDLDGISKQEWKKYLRRISDESLIQVLNYESHIFEETVKLILLERMRKWSNAKLAKAVTEETGGLKFTALAYRALVNRMAKLPLRKAENIITRSKQAKKIVRAALNSNKASQEIKELRRELELPPLS